MHGNKCYIKLISNILETESITGKRAEKNKILFQFLTELQKDSEELIV